MNVAVIGLGFMGSTHVRAWQQVSETRVAAVMSSDDRKLAGDLSGVGGNLSSPAGNMDFSDVRKYRELGSVLADREIDAVDICLPSDRHFEAAQLSLRAGKHVLVEKPLALQGDEADLLVGESAGAGRILMAAQVLRFIPEYRKLAEVLRDKRLGTVGAAFFRRRCGAPAWSRWQTDLARSGGAVMDLLIHDVDFCLRLFGKPMKVSGIGMVDLSRGIDILEARLQFENSCPVIITGGWHHPKSYPFQMEFTVVSEGGTLEFRSGDGPLRLFDSNGSAESIETVGQDPFVEELKYFADCVRNRRQPEFCMPAESARAVRVGRLLMESRDRRGEEIECRF